MFLGELPTSLRFEIFILAQNWLAMQYYLPSICFELVHDTLSTLFITLFTQIFKPLECLADFHSFLEFKHTNHKNTEDRKQF